MSSATGKLVAALYASTIFLGAFLLFLLQPLVAKLELPLFGGSPAIWGTCLVFFQGLLLAGYAYSHWSVKWLSPRAHQIVHGILLLLPLLAMPPAIDPGWAPLAGRWPVPALLVALVVAGGAPFFVLSTNSSLCQRWFASRDVRDPYFLYAASNAGSLIALLAYPVVVEPRLGLRAQGLLFLACYVVWAALSFVAMLAASRVPPRTPAPAAAAPSRTLVLRWVSLSAVTSTLLVGASTYISTDVAPIPLLWVAPLAAYLASFILAFLPWVPYPRRLLEAVAGFVLASALAIMLLEFMPGGMRIPVGVSLAAVFFGGWLLHGDLARSAPLREHLTAFYLWISLGGFLGGVFANLVAPVLFDGPSEYPLALALLAFAIAATSTRNPVSRAKSLRFDTLGLVTLAGLMSLWWIRDLPGLQRVQPLLLFIPLAMLLLGLIQLERPRQLAFAALLVAMPQMLGYYTGWKRLAAERSYFGVIRIIESNGNIAMMHGTTTHAIQLAGDPNPASYYHASAPMSLAVSSAPDAARIGVVGLGAGALAAKTREGQRLTFYEIDPIVEPIARRWFGFLAGAKGEIDVVLGDARLTLRDAAEGELDLLVVDAFSSDAIPVHLLTREAFALYRSRLKPDGLLIVHISNRYLRLEPVVVGAGRANGWSAARWHYRPTRKLRADAGVYPSDVVALGSDAAIAGLEGKYERVGDDAAAVEWTDDRSSLLGLLKF